jgi:DNA-binding response OmpR family regulator
VYRVEDTTMTTPHASAALDGPTVIMVGYDDESGSVIGRLAARAGYRVVLALSAEAALVLLRIERAAAFIIDDELPLMPASDLVRRLRSRIDTATAPIIVLSTADSPIAALEAGADDFLTKPVVPDELIARLAAQLAIRERAATASRASRTHRPRAR